MTFVNKFLKLFSWICFFITIAIIAKAAIDPHYGIDKGLNSDANPILLLPEEAQTSQNVYYSNKKIIKRPGTEDIAQYTAGTDVNDINGIESFTISSQGIFNSQNWENILTTNSSDQAVFELRTTDDIGTVNTTEETIYTEFPTVGIWTTNGREGDFNMSMDCASVKDLYLCGISNLGFTETSNRAFAIDLQTIDLRLENNLAYDFEDATEFSCADSCATNTAYTTYTDVKNGASGASITKNAGSAVAVAIYTLDNSINVTGYGEYYIYLNVGGSTNLAKISSIKVGVSTAGYATDYKLYTLSGLSASGKYYYVGGSATTSGSTNTNDINYIIVELTTIGADTLTSVKVDAFTFAPKFFPSVGPGASSAAPTTAAGAAGVLTGTYKYKTSCTDWGGNEGNASSASSGSTVSSKKIDLSNISVAACAFDTRYINIYRNKNGGTVYYYLTTITYENTTYTDNTADSSLDTTRIAPESGTVNDNSAPLDAKYVESHKNRIWLAGFFDYDHPENLSRIVYSDYSENGSEPFSFRVNDYLDIQTDDGQEIRGLKAFNDSLYVFKEESIYEIVGDAPENFAVVLISPAHGAVSNRAIVSDGNVIYFLDKYGIYAFDGDNFLEISQPIRNIFVDSAMTQRELYAFAEYNPVNKQVWFVLPASPTVSALGSTTAYIYHIETGAWSTYTFKNTGSCTATEMTAMRYVKESPTRGRMHLGTADKSVIRYAKNTSDTLLTADDGSCTIAASWRSKSFYQSEGGLLPSQEKIYDYAYLVADTESSGDISFDWGFDWNYSTVNSETVSLVDSTTSLITNKTYLTGGSGANRSMWFGFSDTSATDTFTVHGVELHYQGNGGER